MRYEQDDDFILEENDANGLKIQPDGVNGFRFVSDPTNKAEDVYSLQVPTESTKPKSNDVSNHALSASEPKEASKQVLEVYSLKEPEPIPVPSFSTNGSDNEIQSNARRSEKDSNSTKKAEQDYEDPELSLEEIYARKREERIEKVENILKVKRPELPERPFWDRIFRPFISAGFLLRLAIMSAVAFIPLFLASYFFIRTISDEVLQLLTEHKDVNVLEAFFSCLWRDKVILLLVCFIWAVFSVPQSFHIFVETANGTDKIEDWPEYNFVGGFGQFLWILALIALAGIPGAALFSALGLRVPLGFTLSATCLSPVFFLSCMQADALFSLITKDVFKSFKRVLKSWICMWGISYAFLFGTIALVMTTIALSVHFRMDDETTLKPNLSEVGIIALILSIVLTFIPALYMRFLGRFAWIVEDDVRKRETEEAENSSTED